ncbi:hypothetical protein HAX54_038664 [Datura stramonium]|uniref:Uncharacterized protein n=1 Tax=Datura stramonium TaxID=4076 RepID=A0ABS8VMG9_DATST|nr:hypothetical protein [Datura stramonium]
MTSEKLAEELVQMFVSETIIKRLLVMEICSIGSEDLSQVDRLKWNDHFYVGEFDDLRICISNYNEVFKQLLPRVESCNSQSTTMQSSSQLERNVLQVYLTTWLAEVNVDRFRIGELFAMSPMRRIEFGKIKADLSWALDGEVGQEELSKLSNKITVVFQAMNASVGQYHNSGC